MSTPPYDPQSQQPPHPHLPDPGEYERPPKKAERGPYHVSKPVRQGQITLTNALLIAILIVQLIMLSYGA